VFERFTDRARRVVVLAQEEARRLDQNFIGTEHLLLGLLHVDDTAGQLLEGLGFGLDETRARVEAAAKPQGHAPSGHIPFTPRAKKTLEMSLREALQLGDSFIGGEHILLGLLRVGKGLGAEILHERGLRLDEIRRSVALVDRDTRRGSGGAPDGSEMASIPVEELHDLVEEVARLRDLLRHHGIDPEERLPRSGEISPELGTDGEAPVA
jgi:ATP-dependent Clp protease ATP-binding subunit ClpC